MATLLNTLQVSQMAFRWNATTRVYRTDTLKVFGREDGESWEYANGTAGQVIQGVWLSFQIASQYHQRVSPQGSAGNDWIDVKNAIINPAETVEFYPIYSIDNAISYAVLSNAADRVPLLNVKRGLQKITIGMNIKAQTRSDNYPTWLRKTRQY